MADNIVTKALSQEDQTVVANIMSMCQELLSMSGTGAQAAAQTPETPDQSATDVNSTATMAKSASAKKAIESAGTDTNTQTGKKKTEETIETVLPEETQDTISEVGKALIQLLTKGAKPVVQKAENPVVDALNGLAQIVKKTADDQQIIFKNIEGLGETLEGVMKATGVLKQIEIAQKSVTVEPVQKAQPAMTQDAAAFMNLLTGLVNKGQNQPNDPKAWKIVNSDVGYQPVAKSLTQDMGGGVSALELLVGGGKPIRR